MSRNIPGPARSAFSRRFPTLILELYLPARWGFLLETWTVSTLASAVRCQKRADRPHG